MFLDYIHSIWEDTRVWASTFWVIAYMVEYGCIITSICVTCLGHFKNKICVPLAHECILESVATNFTFIGWPQKIEIAQFCLKIGLNGFFQSICVYQPFQEVVKLTPSILSNKHSNL